MRLSTALIAASLIALSTAAAQAADITASAAWSRPTISVAMAGVVYVTLTDTGAKDTLVGAKTPVAAHADMHVSREVDGVMEMLPVPSLAISKTAPIKFSPSGYHVMLTGLRQTLSPGQTFPLTFTFAQGPSVTVTVTVLPMGATGPDDAMAGMKM